MKTCPNPTCNYSGFPDDAKFCPKCGSKINVCPSVMPNEVDYRDEFLGISDWRMVFHYMINGQYKRFSGKISDEKSSSQKTFVINCKENGYVRDITLFHNNGQVASYMKFGLYVQDCFDNVEQAEFYSETGQSITRENFIALYESLLDSLDSKMNQIKTADSAGPIVDDEEHSSSIKESVSPAKSVSDHQWSKLVKEYIKKYLTYVMIAMASFSILNLLSEKKVSWGVILIAAFLSPLILILPEVIADIQTFRE